MIGRAITRRSSSVLKPRAHCIRATCTTVNFPRATFGSTENIVADISSTNRRFASNISNGRIHSTPGSKSLRSFIRSFLQKCHPDVQTDEKAKEVNLLAVQNLNSYLDSVQDMLVNYHSTKLRKPERPSVSVDFIIPSMNANSEGKKKLRHIHLRKQVSLRLPPWELILKQKDSGDVLTDGRNSSSKAQKLIEQHVVSELFKLLRVAGLEVPAYEFLEDNDSITDDETNLSLTFGNRPHHRRVMSRYERSRKRFVANIDWKKYQQVYQQALRDAQADMATHQLLRNNPRARRQHLSAILKRIQVFEPTISAVEQAIAFRRLALLLDENFDELGLDDWGRHWETVNLVLVNSRDFVYKMDSDDQVTFQIPVDWPDDTRLIRELQDGMMEYNDWHDDGLDDIFVSKEKRKFVF